jgi:hypothetical protein
VNETDDIVRQQRDACLEQLNLLLELTDGDYWPELVSLWPELETLYPEHCPSEDC